MDMSWILIAVLTVLVAMVVLSYIVEALAVCPEAARNIGLGPQDSDRVCGSRRHESPPHQNWGGPEPRSPANGPCLRLSRARLVGHSKSRIRAQDFYQWMAAHLDRIDIRQATIVGMRLRNRFLSDRIFEGGLASPQALPKELAEELYEVGARLGHYQSF